MADLRVAIIGYGLSGRVFHAPLIAATRGLTVASVVTSSPQRQAEVARDHSEARALSSADRLWERDDHDLVVIATPNDTHLPLATAAIDHGLPVVVDKPLAVTAARAQQLVLRAQRAGVLLTVFQNRRWDSDHLTVRRLLDGGHLGEVIRYESRFERWRPSPKPGSWRETLGAGQGGGLLLDLGSHLVDQALTLFGPVTHIYAEVDARRGLPADDDDFIALRHASGTISHLRASAVTGAPGPRLRVLGSEAAFVLTRLDSQEDRLRAGERPDTVADWGVEPGAHRGRLVTGDASVPVPGERGDWAQFYALLATALREGGPPPVDPADAVAALRVIEQARQSAATQTTISVA
ncbi:MAG TPA: Gfo/Idh/MocA family oxidoreductase [Solirubrobacteraceae bacterium]|nr:Gfo/Idh/MocA family oxidoreductase [Solirubrobacteraceae bacterium]